MNKTNCTSIWRLAGPGALVCYALLAPLSALCSSLFALSLQPVVDTGLSGDLARFGLACLAAFLLGAVDLGLNHWTVCRQAALVHRCTNRLCQHYLHQILAQKVERLQGQDSAVYLSKLTADAPLISSGYLGNALDLYRSAWSLIASLAVLAAAGWELAALAVLCALVSLSLPKLLQRSADRAEAAYLDANRTHLAQAQEILTNFLLIRLYGLAPEQEARYGNAATQVERADNRRQVVRQRMNTLGSAISQLSFVLLLAGAMLLVIQGKLSVGYTMSLTQLLGGVMFPFEVLPGYWMALQTGKRLYRSNLEQLQNGLDTPGVQLLPHPPRQLALHGVSFAYPNRSPLVENLTLRLDCTKKYALVGGQRQREKHPGQAASGLSHPHSWLRHIGRYPPGPDRIWFSLPCGGLPEPEQHLLPGHSGTQHSPGPLPLPGGLAAAVATGAAGTLGGTASTPGPDRCGGKRKKPLRRPGTAGSLGPVSGGTSRLSGAGRDHLRSGP